MTYFHFAIMKRWLLIFLFFCVSSAFLKAQQDTTYTPSEPVGGIEMLALAFYDIEFTGEQRKVLSQKPLEYFFYVSDAGVARLESVNGINNSAILDSLYSFRENLPPFTPATRGGVAVQSLYSMQMTFPDYDVAFVNFGSRPVGKYRLADFDTLAVDHNYFQMLIGGYACGFTGTANDFLKTGGGLKFEVLGFGSKQMYYGMNMAFNGNKQKKPYFVDDERDQNEVPPTLFLGVTVGRFVDNFLVQLDANIVVQNIVSVDTNSEEDPVQFWGFSPGLIVNYPIPIASRINISYLGQFQTNHYINLHAGYRSLFMDDNQGLGGMWEVGVSYRIGTRQLKYFKLAKEQE